MPTDGKILSTTLLEDNRVVVVDHTDTHVDGGRSIFHWVGCQMVPVTYRDLWDKYDAQVPRPQQS